MRARFLLVALLGLPACATDECAAMCDAARDRFAACMEEAGLEWGASVGYTDAADYDDWCATYSWELRQLGRADTCAERVPTFEAGSCDDYYDAWEEP